MVDLTLFEFELKVLQGIPKMTTAMSRDDWNCFRNDFKRTSKGTQMKYRFCLPCGQIWSLKARLFLQLIILVLIWYSSLKTNDVYHQSTPMPPMISSNSTCFYSVRWFSWAFWCRPPCVCVCVYEYGFHWICYDIYDKTWQNKLGTHTCCVNFWCGEKSLWKVTLDIQSYRTWGARCFFTPVHIFLLDRLLGLPFTHTDPHVRYD